MHLSLSDLSFWLSIVFRMIRLTLLAAAAFAGSALGAVMEGRSALDADLGSYDAREESWPYGPFKTKGRDIVNSRGDKITWAGINWPMSGKCL